MSFKLTDDKIVQQSFLLHSGLKLKVHLPSKLKNVSHNKAKTWYKLIEKLSWKHPLEHEREFSFQVTMLEFQSQFSMNSY